MKKAAGWIILLAMLAAFIVFCGTVAGYVFTLAIIVGVCAAVGLMFVAIGWVMDQ